MPPHIKLVVIIPRETIVFTNISKKAVPGYF